MKSILCVEDDITMLTFYQKLFQKRGFRYRTCHTAEEASVLLAEQSPDLIVLDVCLPGESGLAFSARLNKDARYAKIPVIMVSSTDDEEVIVDALTHGADDYLVKPISGVELIAKVAVALDKQAGKNEPTGGQDGRFGERYEIVTELGASNHATVYYAIDLSQDPPANVSLKIYDGVDAARAGANANELTELIDREYDYADVRHPSFCTLRDHGRSGQFFFVATDLVVGSSLTRLVEQLGSLSGSNLEVMGAEIAKFLQWLENLDKHHLNITPNNILIADDGSIKLTDFALRSEESRGAHPLHGAEGAAFMAPELIWGAEEPTVGCDIFSLGACLYFAGAGVAPFSGESSADIVREQFNTPPTLLSERNPDISPTLANLVQQMLLPNARQRPCLLSVHATLENMVNDREAVAV